MKNDQQYLYVRPFVTGIIIEIFVKSIVLQEDPGFNPLHKQYRHNTTAIINTYKEKIPIVNEIANDTYLMVLIESTKIRLIQSLGKQVFLLMTLMQKWSLTLHIE